MPMIRFKVSKMKMALVVLFALAFMAVLSWNMYNWGHYDCLNKKLKSKQMQIHENIKLP